MFTGSAKSVYSHGTMNGTMIGAMVSVGSGNEVAANVVPAPAIRQGAWTGQIWQHTVLESPAELRDAMRAEIRQLRAENQRLKSELAGKEFIHSGLPSLRGPTSAVVG